MKLEFYNFLKNFISSLLLVGLLVDASAGRSIAQSSTTIPSFLSDRPACKVKSVEKATSEFENVGLSPKKDLLVFTALDSSEVYQVYVTKVGEKDSHCITCTQVQGGPKVDRNKPMLSWHPSGDWLVVGIEEDSHDLDWAPISWQRGLLQSGIWLNIWITTPAGDRWYQITNWDTSKAPNNGYVGVSFTPDGKRGVWAEIVDGNVFVNAFGIWKLFIADFSVTNGVPSFLNKREITPIGAKWVEPGNFDPAGRKILLSTDIGITNAQGQDQVAFDVDSKEAVNLTNSPLVWDEHGLYSRDGSKIVFMSSLPFANEPDSYKTASLKTEFLIMDADGSHIQQVTHFNVPGHSESQQERTIAAVAGFVDDGTQLFAFVMGPNFTKTNWLITFEGACGVNAGVNTIPSPITGLRRVPINK